MTNPLIIIHSNYSFKKDITGKAQYSGKKSLFFPQAKFAGFSGRWRHG